MANWLIYAICVIANSAIVAVSNILAFRRGVRDDVNRTVITALKKEGIIEEA